MTVQETMRRIKQEGVVLVVRADSHAEALAGIRAVAAGGIKGIEITFTVPDAPALIREVAKALGPDILLGAGTVTKPEQAQAAVEAGATYLVAPNTDEKVIGAAKRLGVVAVPGAFTATEVLHAWDLGADIVKIYPATIGGPAYIKALKAPIPYVPLMPSGGVDEKNVGEFLKAGAYAVGTGGALFDPKRIKAQDWKGMTETAARFVAAMKAARA